MIRLPLHRTYTGILKEEPVVNLVALSRPLRERDLIIGIVLFNKILEYASGLKDADGLAVGEGVSYGGDPAVGINFQEPWLLLSICRNVDIVDGVWKTEFFEGDGDFDAVGGLVREECYVWFLVVGGHGGEQFSVIEEVLYCTVRGPNRQAGDILYTSRSSRMKI